MFKDAGCMITWNGVERMNVRGEYRRQKIRVVWYMCQLGALRYSIGRRQDKTCK